MIIEISYAMYLTISVAMTIWVAHTLSTNGRVFLLDAFAGREDLADSINHMLVVGFYLINLGYVALALRFGSGPVSLPEAIEFLSTKIGLVLLVLGAMHFFLMHVIVRWGRKAASDWYGRKEDEAGRIGTADV